MLQAILTATAVLGLLFVREGASQCFSNADCTGDVVPATDQRSCCVDTNNGLSYWDGSTCSQCIVHGFLQATYDVIENERLDTMFQLNVKGTTPLTTLTVIGTITAAADGSASEADFEQLVPISVTNSAEIRLFTTNDEITLETNERILLTFTPDSSGLIDLVEGEGEFIRGSAIVNIIDNDLLQINFGESDYSIVEGQTMLSTRITLLMRASQREFRITLCPSTIREVENEGLGFFISSDTITNSSRATAGDDFSTNKTTVVIPAGARTFQVPTFFMIVDDNIDEDEQSFAIIAEIEAGVPDDVACFQSDVGETGCLGRKGVTEIRITDNDPMIIGFTERSQTVSEGEIEGVDSFPVSIGVSNVRTAERVHTMTFRYQESSSTATVEPLAQQTSSNFDALFGSRDQPTDPIQVTFDLEPEEDSIQPLTAQIINDFIAEPDECFNIRIFPVDVAGRRELFSCNEDDSGETSFFCEYTVCITNDDEPFVVAFVETFYTVDESVAAVTVCVNLTQPQIDIFENTVNVFVIDDVNSVYIPANATLATPDPPDFLSRYQMIERSDYAQQTSPVNAIDDVLITELMRVVCYNQSIYDDLRLELDEFAGLTLRVRVNPLTTVLTIVEPFYDQASILIRDDDRAVVGLEQTFFRVEENVGFIEVCVNVSFPDIECPIEFPFQVELSTVDGTAVRALDYMPVNVTLMFGACETRRCVNMEITDDQSPEQDESFSFHLTGTSDPRIELNPVYGLVDIVDNDLNVTVGYSPVRYTTSEGQGAVNLTIQVFTPSSGGTPVPFTLIVSTQDGSAMAGAPERDYVAVNREIIQFNAGDSVKTHSIIINDDMTCEDPPNEFFFSNIVLESAGQPVVAVTQPQATVFIDDSGEAECNVRVGYETTVYTTPEGDVSVELCVVLYEPVLGGGAPRPFTLTYQTADGTALGGVDYVSSTGQLTFNTGDSRQCHSVQILQDDVCELPEQEFFFSRLTLASGAQVITVNPNEARVIIDDRADCPTDVRVGYETTIYTTPEGDMSVELCVVLYEPVLGGGAPRPFTLTYQTADGTALGGVDYVSSTGQLTFNTGDSRQCHSVQILQDDVCELPEQEFFFSRLTLASGAQVITVNPNEARVIIDDRADCPSGVLVNDTVTGDPLMTVPIWTGSVDPGDNVESLCYEVHGEENTYFNLISDECTSVNGYFQRAVPPTSNLRLNVITQIGVRARGNSDCWNIQVDLDTCSAAVNGTPPPSGSFDGVTVRSYPSSSRVRISVPNCADSMLVLWVFCREGQVEDPATMEFVSIRFIRLVVRRGLNLNEQSHGLIGQFWNVPVSIVPYTGLTNGEQLSSDYIITVNHPDSDPRNFVGLKYNLTWESERRVCYYSGNSQAGPISEVDPDVNDPVIEGNYREYKVDSLFATNFKYAHFEESRC